MMAPALRPLQVWSDAMGALWVLHREDSQGGGWWVWGLEAGPKAPHTTGLYYRASVSLDRYVGEYKFVQRRARGRS